MPFTRPGLAALREQAAADVASRQGGADPLLPNSNLGVMADVLAEGVNGNYAYLDWVAKQSVPFTAVGEALEGWAAAKGVVRKPATEATGVATFAASGPATIEAGAPISRADGATYRVVAEVSVVAAGPIAVQIVAEKAGAASTLINGAPVILGEAVAGVSASGTAVSVTPGADLEEAGAFRTRMLQVYAEPPQGGADADYRKWAREVPGVTRAWCRPLAMGPGTVAVYFMMDEVRADDGGFPRGASGVATLETRAAAATGDQLVVADYIHPRRPVTALVYAVAPLANTVTFTINLEGASAGVKAAVADAIDAVFLAYGEPGGRVNNDTVEAAIRAIAGTSGFVITGTACSHGAVTPGAAGNIQSNAGRLPVRAPIVWTP